MSQAIKNLMETSPSDTYTFFVSVDINYHKRCYSMKRFIRSLNGNIIFNHPLIFVIYQLQLPDN